MGLEIRSDVVYHIKSKSGGSGLKLLGCTSDGDDLNVYEKDDDRGRQEWQLKLVPGTTDIFNVKNIRGVYNGRVYLSCRADGFTDLYYEDGYDEASGVARQRWKLTELSDGYYTIEVVGGTNAGEQYLSCSPDGKTVDLYSKDDGSGRQQWKLEMKASDESSYTKHENLAAWYALKPVQALYTVSEKNSINLAKLVFSDYVHQKQGGIIYEYGYDHMDFHEGIRHWIDNNRNTCFSSWHAYKDALLKSLSGDVNFSHDIPGHYIEHWIDVEDCWFGGNYPVGIDAYFCYRSDVMKTYHLNLFVASNAYKGPGRYEILCWDRKIVSIVVDKAAT